MSAVRICLRTFGACAALLAMVACMDVDPVEAQGGTGGQPDAGSSPGPCELCLEAKPAGERACEEPLTACAEDPKCGPLLACSFASGCFETTTQEDANECGFPCALRVGVTSSVEPAVALMFAVGECALVACPTRCFAQTE